MIAPRIGPHIRSQVIGGPACSNRFGFMPGMTSMACLQADELWHAAEDQLHRAGICRLDCGPVHPDPMRQTTINVHRRLPVHLDHWHVGIIQRLLEARQPKVDDL